MTGLVVYAAMATDPERFVAYWSELYDPAGDAAHYTNHIGKPLTPGAVRDLFLWKNGSRLSARKARSVEVNFVSRLEELHSLSADMDAGEFLERFPKGGAIWRIFWLHCWQPLRFPIYDQHVHRAMSFVVDGRGEEITGWSDSTKITTYLQQYLHFWRGFDGIDPRSVDRALWAFGKFIKASPLPGIAAQVR